MSILAKVARAVRNDAPAPYVPRTSSQLGLFGGAGPASLRDQLDATGGSGTLFAIVDATSTAVASTRWELYRKPGDGEQDENRERVTKHAAHALWAEPTGRTGGFTRSLLVETVQQHIDLSGEGYLLVVKAAGIPIELWPARPDRMTPVPHPTKYLAGWIYTSPDGERIPFKPDEVIQIRKPDPMDAYRGLSAVASVSTDLDAARLASEWNRNFFLNSAEPGGVIEVERRLSDDEFDEMHKRWNEQHKGVRRAHRVAVIEQGKWAPRTITQRDMQFAELRHVSRDVIMESFRISKTALGITDDVNRASALAAEYQFSRHLTVPRLDRWCHALNHQLLPMFGATGKGVEFGYASPVDEDEEAANAERDSKVNAVVQIMSIPGVKFDVNDVFRAYALPEIDYEESAPPPPAAPVPPPVEPALPALPPQAPAQAVRNATGGPDLTEVQEAWERALDRLMATWTDLTADQRARLHAQVTDAIDAGDLAELASLQVDSEEAARALEDALVALAEVAAARAAEEAAEQDVALSVVVPAGLAAVAATVAGLLAADLAASAGREALRLATPGRSGAEVAADVDAALRERSDATARAQLGGALTGAQNRARAETFASGPVGSLYADETLDQGTCPPCRKVNGRFVANTDDLAAYELLYTPMGGYVDCEGGVRCRGTVVGAWRQGIEEA